MWYPNANVPGRTLPHLRLTTLARPKERVRARLCPRPRQEQRKEPKEDRREELRLEEDQEERVQEQERNQRHNQVNNPTRRSQQQPKAKPKPKATAHSADAGNMEIDWMNADVYDPASSSGAFPSPPFAGLASVEDFASVCTFYTTYNPSFHSSEQADENGLLPPILDTGATHCLLPGSWLTPEQAAFSKRIHLRVASGTSV